MIPVVRLEPVGHWDQTMVDDLIMGELWPHGVDVEFCDPWPENVPGIILVIPGRFWCDEEPRTGDWQDINTAIQQYEWVLAFRIGDEEDWFDVHKISHPNIRWWVQEPRGYKNYGDAKYVGVGYTPHFASLLPVEPVGKYIDVFLSGQNTHPRRNQCFEALKHVKGNVESNPTEGFTQGLPKHLYLQKMLRTKIVPCPSGPATPDTFRLYEALQSHCIPIADGNCPNWDANGYWAQLHPTAPFPVASYWDALPQLCERLLENWPANANRISAWWEREKKRLADMLVDDLKAFNSLESYAEKSPITVVIPVSPIISHPDIFILEETLASIKHHLPDSEIIITFDGVRREQEHLRLAYEEAIRRTLWRCAHHWRHVTPVIFDSHLHQIGMMRSSMDHITTPLLLYVEQDCPLVTTYPIDWPKLTSFLLDGHGDLIRLHHEAQILAVHQHMTHGKQDHFTKTSQWSQRPHLATKAFYTRVMQQFTPHANCFLEDKMASVLECAYNDFGMLGWAQWRCWIYTPDTPDIKRSYTLDGRANQPKYDENQRF